MDYLSSKESFQTLSRVSSSESFLSSLEVVINGRKNTDFAPYLRRTLSPLPPSLASFLFYALIYIHFHLLMLIIVLRVVVDNHVMKMGKVQNFYERLKDYNSNKDLVSSVVKRITDIQKNIYLSQVMMIDKFSNEETTKNENNIVFPNKSPSSNTFDEIENTNPEVFHDFDSNTNDNDDFEDVSSELINTENALFNDDNIQKINTSQEV
uniref:Uncharacterized protein n=1 Tax=Strongyloides papillosus TaxID=174720 RepID=A0A0N5CGI4_STREA